MRKSDIFRSLTACIVEKRIEERREIAQLLRNLGGKDIIYFDTLKDAVNGFLKYHAKIPDYIVSTWSDEEFIDQILISNYKTSVLHNVPLIVISQEDSPSTIAQSNSIGASQFLVKPVSEEVLRTSIMHVFRRKFRL